MLESSKSEAPERFMLVPNEMGSLLLITYAQVGNRVCEYISKGSTKTKTFYPLVWIVEQYKHSIPQTPALAPQTRANPREETAIHDLAGCDPLSSTIAESEFYLPHVTSLEAEDPIAPFKLTTSSVEGQMAESSSTSTSLNTQVAVGVVWPSGQVIAAVVAMVVLQHVALYLHLTTTTYWTCKR